MSVLCATVYNSRQWAWGIEYTHSRAVVYQHKKEARVSERVRKREGGRERRERERERGSDMVYSTPTLTAPVSMSYMRVPRLHQSTLFP